MNPNAGEPVNPGATTVADNPVSVASSPDVARVEGLVAAAQKEPVAQTTPEAQFKNQFGLPPQATTPPVADNPTVGPGLIDTALASLGTPPSGENSTNVPVVPLDPSIKTVRDLLEKGPQVVESNSEVKLPPEVQEFLDSVLNAAHKYEASEEETKEEVVV